MAPRPVAPLYTRKVIYAAVVGNLLVAATKFAAATVGRQIRIPSDCWSSRR